MDKNKNKTDNDNKPSLAADVLGVIAHASKEAISTALGDRGQELFDIGMGGGKRKKSTTELNKPTEQVDKPNLDSNKLINRKLNYIIKKIAVSSKTSVVKQEPSKELYLGHLSSRTQLEIENSRKSENLTPPTELYKDEKLIKTERMNKILGATTLQLNEKQVKIIDTKLNVITKMLKKLTKKIESARGGNRSSTNIIPAGIGKGISRLALGTAAVGGTALFAKQISQGLTGDYTIDPNTGESVSGENALGLQTGMQAAGMVAGGLYARRGINQIASRLSAAERKTLALNRYKQYAKAARAGTYGGYSSTAWQRYLSYLQYAKPALYRKIGTRLASLGVLAAIPGPGWVAAILGIGLNVALAVDLYNAWKAFNKLPEEEQSMWDKIKSFFKSTFSIGGDDGEEEEDSAADIGSGKKSTDSTSITPTENEDDTSGKSESSDASSGGSQKGLNATWAELNEAQKREVMEAQAKREGYYKEGSIPQRANNPGAIIFGDHAKKFGATEYIEASRGIKIAKFPNLESGMKAQRALWDSDAYSNLPLQDAIRQWVTGTKNPYPGGDSPGVKNYLKAVEGALANIKPTSETAAQETTPAEETPEQARLRKINEESTRRFEQRKQADLSPVAETSSTNVNPIQNSGGATLRSAGKEYEQQRLAAAPPVIINNAAVQPIVAPPAQPKQKMPQIISTIDESTPSSAKIAFNADRWMMV